MLMYLAEAGRGPCTHLHSITQSLFPKLIPTTAIRKGEIERERESHPGAYTHDAFKISSSAKNHFLNQFSHLAFQKKVSKHF